MIKLHLVKFKNLNKNKKQGIIISVYVCVCVFMRLCYINNTDSIF